MAEQADEKRAIGRVRTILAAQAVVGRGLPDVACTVRDISDTGARIIISGGSFLPDRFELRIPKKGIARTVEVKWRAGTMLGIRFVPEGADADDPLARIRQLEAENAELRRRVADLVERLFAYGDTERSVV